MISMLPAIFLLLLVLINRCRGMAMVVVVRLGDLSTGRGKGPCLEERVV